MLNKVLIFIIILLATLVLISLFLFNQKGVSLPSSIPVFNPSPTPIPFISIKPSVFFVISTNPQKDKLYSITVGTPISVYFNKELTPDNFKFTTTPEIETEINFLTYGVTFIPKTNWPLGQEVTILITSAKSRDSFQLSAPYEIKFQAPIPTGE